jgi:hypothetical protein
VRFTLRRLALGLSSGRSGLRKQQQKSQPTNDLEHRTYLLSCIRSDPTSKVPTRPCHANSRTQPGAHVTRSPPSRAGPARRRPIGKILSRSITDLASADWLEQQLAGFRAALCWPHV